MSTVARSGDIEILTPEGQKVFVPQGATVVDYAYQLNRELADKLVACKIQDELVPLRSELRTGDTVTLFTAPHVKPNPGWLRFVKTELAKQLIYENLFGRDREPDHASDAPKYVARLRIATEPVNAEMIHYLAKHPNDIYTISPRRFEELTAELLRDMGYDVLLTPSSHDQGRDILAVLKLPTHQILTIVDCKKYSPERPIGPDIIHRLLWVSEHHDRASHAMIATTSTFTSGAIKLASSYSWQVSLKDIHDITDWLSKYGSWQRPRTGDDWYYFRESSER